MVYYRFGLVFSLYQKYFERLTNIILNENNMSTILLSPTPRFFKLRHSTLSWLTREREQDTNKNAGRRGSFGAATLRRRYRSYHSTLWLGPKIADLRGVV